MLQWHATHPVDWIPDGSVLLTATASSGFTLGFAKALRDRQYDIAGVIEWDEFCRSLLDPEDRRWECSVAVCLALLRFEDWDHFSDHLRDRSITPSYQLVRKKTNDLIQCLRAAANRTNSKFGVLVQWSELARRCEEVNCFFEGVTADLEQSVEDYPNIVVIRQWATVSHSRAPVAAPVEVL